jgi:DNA-binding response OmpR family regulator
MKPPRKSSITINHKRNEVFKDGKEVRLAPKEYLLLVALTESGGTMSRSELLHKVWGHDLDSGVESRTIDQHLSRLRRKVGRGVIDTVPSFGYRISVPA